MKIYKKEEQNSENGNYKDVYLTFNDDDITNITNSYGCWISNSADELEQYNFEENNNDTFSISENELRSEWIVILSNFDFENLTQNEVDIIIKLSTYTIDNSDEANSDVIYEINLQFIDNSTDEFLDIQENEPMIIGKKYEYWNGNNWKHIILSSDIYDVDIENVTKQFEDFDNKIKIGQTEIIVGRYTEYYTILKNDEKVILRKECTCWSGELNKYYLIDDELDMIEIFDMF